MSTHPSAPGFAPFSPVGRDVGARMREPRFRVRLLARQAKNPFSLPPFEFLLRADAPGAPAWYDAGNGRVDEHVLTESQLKHLQERHTEAPGDPELFAQATRQHDIERARHCTTELRLEPGVELPIDPREWAAFLRERYAELPDGTNRGEDLLREARRLLAVWPRSPEAFFAKVGHKTGLRKLVGIEIVEALPSEIDEQTVRAQADRDDAQRALAEVMATASAQSNSQIAKALEKLGSAIERLVEPAPTTKGGK